MDLSRYALFAAEVNASELLNDWRWLIPNTYTSVLLTKFGDWFFKTEANRAIFLDLLEGTLFDLGDFSDLSLGTEGFMASYKDQLSVDWIELCLERGKVIQSGQCYGWEIHPLLGGSLKFENIKIFSLNAYQSLMGQMFRQLKPGMRITGFSVPRTGNV